MYLVTGGETAGSGFKAQYTFETEYQIPGTHLSDENDYFLFKLHGEIFATRDSATWSLSLHLSVNKSA